MLVSWYVWSIRQHFCHPWLRQWWLSRINSPIDSPCSLKHMGIDKCCSLGFLHFLDEREMIHYTCHSQPYSPLDSLLHHENDSSVRFKFSLLIIIHLFFFIDLLFFIFVRVVSKLNLFLYDLLSLSFFRLSLFFFLGSFLNFFLVFFSEIPDVYIWWTNRRLITAYNRWTYFAFRKEHSLSTSLAVGASTSRTTCLSSGPQKII